MSDDCPWVPVPVLGGDPVSFRLWPAARLEVGRQNRGRRGGGPWGVPLAGQPSRESRTLLWSHHHRCQVAGVCCPLLQRVSPSDHGSQSCCSAHPPVSPKPLLPPFSKVHSLFFPFPSLPPFGLFNYVYECSACMSVAAPCLVPTENGSGLRVPWN